MSDGRGMWPQQPPSGPWGTPMTPPPTPPAGPTGRRWTTWQLALASLVAMLVGVGIGGVALSSDGDGDEQRAFAEDEAAERDDERDERRDEEARETDREEESTTTERREPTTTTRPRPTTTPAPPLGTRENPFALGTPLVSEEGLTIVVNGVNFDSAAAIAAENQFNEPAPPGSRFAVINYTITNGTEESVNTLFAVSVGMVGSANRQYDGANAFCEAVIPQPMSDGGDLFPGGTFTGNDCLVVPEPEVLDGSLLLTFAIGFSGEEVFVRIA